MSTDRECDRGRCAHDVPDRVRADPTRYRCRTCGAILRLDETHHGSHMVDTEHGAVECGAIERTDDAD